MGAKVVDASVLAALAFGEARAAEAKKALRKGRLYAPRLMGYELAHVAVKKISRRPEKKLQRYTVHSSGKGSIEMRDGRVLAF